jgi:bacterial/archaeal transporter family protein
VSAAASALTAILAKLGVVILVVVWVMVFALHEHRALPALSRRSVIFLVFSGLATGVAWFAYFRALQLGPASRVAPIDKLSLPLAVILAAIGSASRSAGVSLPASPS